MIEQTLPSGWTRRFRLIPGWDTRGPDKNYGIHGAHLAFELVRPGLALVAEINTDWMPKSVEKYWDSIGHCVGTRSHFWGWCRHSSERLDEWDTEIEECDFTKGKCYCTRQSVDYAIFPRMISEGDQVIWDELDRRAAELERARQDLARYS